MYQGLSFEISQVMPQARATGLFVSLCTIQDPSGIFEAGGQPDGNYVDVAGLVAIPCMNAPTSEARITATEHRTVEQIRTDNSSHVLLNDFYPAVATHWLTGARAVIDGVAYIIMGVEQDSQSQMTRLKVCLSTL